MMLFKLPLLSLLALPLRSQASSYFPHSFLSQRQIDGGAQGDPGQYPGGADEGANRGWRTLPQVTGANIDNSTFTVENGGAFLVSFTWELK